MVSDTISDKDILDMDMVSNTSSISCKSTSAYSRRYNKFVTHLPAPISWRHHYLGPWWPAELVVGVFSGLRYLQVGCGLGKCVYSLSVWCRRPTTAPAAATRCSSVRYPGYCRPAAGPGAVNIARSLPRGYPPRRCPVSPEVRGGAEAPVTEERDWVRVSGRQTGSEEMLTTAGAVSTNGAAVLTDNNNDAKKVRKRPPRHCSVWEQILPQMVAAKDPCTRYLS